uniref:SAM domain-containing protein n=1 Tax=Wuchereria bancrofti TaxID=6293 RepID=A0AAF5Q3R0_WUCBA
MNSISIEQFLTACETWNLDEVQQAVESGFLVDTFDDDHVTGLQMAAATGNIGIVQYLLDHGADIEKSNQVGMTALHHAAKNGHANIVRILVQRGANYQKLTYLGASPMTLAAASGHIDLIKLLLDLNVNINPTHTALCPTPIIAAAFRRHTHLCALLSQKGAYLDGNIQRLSNLSALSTAITCGATTIVGALLELGANPSFRSLNGMTSTELAQHLQQNEVLTVINSTFRNILKEEEQIEVDLRELIYCNDENAIRMILNRHLPYVSFPENTTPLMYAVLLADINIVKIIQESNITDINAAENVSGLTALMFAAIIGNYEVMEYLINFGADISLISFDGFTAIDYAFAIGNINADLLCLLQQPPGHGTTLPVLSQRINSHQHQHLSRVIYSSKTKILNKLSSHVGRGSNMGNNYLDSKEKLHFSRAHLAKLVKIHQNDDNDEFILANDILKSIGNEKIGKSDKLHRYIEVARFVAENCANQGIINLPVIFTLNKHNLEKNNSIKYGPSLEQIISTGTAINHKHRNFLSIAQWNAYLYYEYRFLNRNFGGAFSNANKRRYLYDDNDNQSSSMLSRQLERHSSTHTLGTIPRFRSRSRETIKRNNNFDENDDGRNSPSRSSLNQYIFSDKDGERLKKSISTPTLDKLIWRCSLSDNSDMNGMKSKLSNRSVARGATYDNAYHERMRQKITEDLIWEKLNEAGLGKYVNLLKDEEVDKGTFLALTNDDLIDIGITDVMHRNKLLKIIKNLRY